MFAPAAMTPIEDSGRTIGALATGSPNPRALRTRGVRQAPRTGISRRHPRGVATNREVIEAYAVAISGNDMDALDRVRHPDFAETWPQSAERVRGRENMRAIDEHYPGRPTEGGPLEVVGSEDRWVMTPQLTMLRIEGTGDVYTMVLKALYPPASTWYPTSIVRLKDNLVWRATTFFAEAFEAPAWRSQWVEPMTDEERDSSI